MTFAAGIFLAGLAAMALPIAIHLLARQRTKVLNWGAMQFLRQSISSATSRRKRLRDLLLLLLRLTAIALLVLAFAQPLISHSLFGGRQLETVFVWDVSLSTTALDTQGQPIQKEMRERLLEELDRLPDRSSARILVSGADSYWLKPDALVLSNTNRKALRRAIENQSTQSGESRLADGILRALLLPDEKASDPKFRDVVVVHDFQKQAWQSEDADRWRAIRKRISEDANRSLRSLDLDAELDRVLPQAVVSKLAAAHDTIAPESPARMQATIRNEAPFVSARGNVVWRIDGREVERSDSIDVPSKSEFKLEQVLRFESEGCHQVTCEFENERDLLPQDNRAACIVSVREALPILIIDDTERTQRGQIRPSEFIIASLGGSLESKPRKPKNSNAQRPGTTSLFAPKVIRSSEWKSDVLEGQLAVFVVAANEMPEDAFPELARFVRDGGGLWLIVDPQQDGILQWEAHLLNELGLEALTDTNVAAGTKSDDVFHLRVSNPASAFADAIVSGSLDLHRAEVRSLQWINRPAVLASERLLETSDGHPVLLTLRAGLGQVLLQTTNLDRKNTNLPILQSFVPFVRAVARETATTSLPKRNLDPGEAIRVPESIAANILGEPAITRPDKKSGKMLANGVNYESGDTFQSGIYSLHSDQTGAPTESKEFFAVKRPAAESNLERMDDNSVASLFKPDVNSTTENSGQSKGKWPLAFWLAIAAALCFLAEALLARMIAINRAKRVTRIDLKPVF